MAPVSDEVFKRCCLCQFDTVQLFVPAVFDILYQRVLVHGAKVSNCHKSDSLNFAIFVFSMGYKHARPGTALALWKVERKKQTPQEGKTMMTLWIVLGALFMTGIGIRFTYRVLGLTPVEATAVFVMIVTLVGVNTGPARQLIMNLF